MVSINGFLKILRFLYFSDNNEMVTTIALLYISDLDTQCLLQI